MNRIKKIFKGVFSVINNPYFIYGWFFISFALFVWLEIDRTVKNVLLYNISSCGYSRPVLFLIWTICLSLFYTFCMSAIRKKYKLINIPLILSCIGIALFLVTGILLPPKNEVIYNVCLYIHCGFAAGFALVNFVGFFISLVQIYLKTKSKVIMTIICSSILVLIGSIIMLCFKPMAGYTELVPITFTVICLLFLVSQNKIGVNNE